MLIIALVGLALSVVAVRYDLYGVDQSKEARTSFPVGKVNAVVQVHPVKGTFWTGFAQTSGKQPAQYTLYYKLTTQASYTSMGKKYLSKNNVYYGPYKVAKPSGYNKYLMKLHKDNNTGSASDVNWDFVVN
jgi:hypothetical protein